MALLRIKDETGKVIDIPALKGDKGDDYVLTDEDKAKIAENVVNDYAIRETIYVGLDGYCYSVNGIAYSISNLNIESVEDLKKYNFVLIWDIGEEYYTLHLDPIYVGTGEMYFSSLVYDNYSYQLIAGTNYGIDEAIDFVTTEVTGEYLKSYYGVLSVDKTALLGDIGDQTVKEYVDATIGDIGDQTVKEYVNNKLEEISTTEPENNTTIEYDYNHVMYDGEGTETATVTMQSEAAEVKLWRSGVNMLPKFTGKTLAGVTFTVDDDGVVTINGTVNYSQEYLKSTMLSAYFDTNGTTLPGMPFNATGTKYTFSVWRNTDVPFASGSILFRCNGTSGATIYTLDTNSNESQGYSATSAILTNSEAIKFVDIYFNNIPNGTTFDNWKCKLQLERGDVASTDYCPPSLTMDVVPVVDGKATKEFTLNAGKNYLVTDADSIHTVIKGVKSERQIESYFGKRWACFGDSITFKYPDSTDLRYHDLVAKDLGLSVINYGVATTGYASEGNRTNGQFYKRMEGISPDSFDVMTIMGSCNDFGVMSRGEKELGTYTDTGTDTVCGCINTTIDKFYELAPLKRLGIITMLPTLYYGDDPNSENGVANDNLLTKAPIAENYVNALIQICKNRGIPCLDLYHGSGLRPWIPKVRDAFFNWDEENQRGDGIHPNDEGVKFFAPLVREFVRSLI